MPQNLYRNYGIAEAFGREAVHAACITSTLTERTQEFAQLCGELAEIPEEMSRYYLHSYSKHQEVERIEVEMRECIDSNDWNETNKLEVSWIIYFFNFPPWVTLAFPP